MFRYNYSLASCFLPFASCSFLRHRRGNSLKYRDAEFFNVGGFICLDITILLPLAFRFLLLAHSSATGGGMVLSVGMQRFLIWVVFVC